MPQTKEQQARALWDTRLETALDLHRKGWVVFPTLAAEKKPDFNRLPLRDPTKTRSQVNRTTYKVFAETPPTEEQIRSWWAAPKRAAGTLPPNIAILTGASGVVVVDIDSYKATDEKVAEVEESLDKSAAVVLSPSGGKHYYFRQPPPPLKLATQNGHKFGAFVDLKSGNGYVNAPSSSFGDGTYEAVGGALPLPSKLPAAPLWAIADENAVVFGDEGKVMPGAWSMAQAWAFPVQEGGDPNNAVMGRKQHIRSMATSYARRGFPQRETEQTLLTWNRYLARPPVAETEVCSLVDLIYRRQNESKGIEDGGGVTLRLPSPSFPHHLLQAARPLHRWAVNFSQKIGVHPDLACFTAIMAASAATVGKYRLTIAGQPQWNPPTLLWGVAVAESGSKKSACVRAVSEALEPTLDYLSTLAGTFNAELATRRCLLEKAYAEAKKKACKISMNKAYERLAALPSPLARHWVADDCTPEAVSSSLSGLPFLLLMSDEGEEVLSSFFGKYSANGTSNFSALLKTYDRMDARALRIGRGEIIIKDAEVSLFTTTQASGLSGLSSAEASDRGFTPRVQWAIVDKECMPAEPLPDVPDQDLGEILQAIFFGGRAAAREQIQWAADYRPGEGAVTVAHANAPDRPPVESVEDFGLDEPVGKVDVPDFEGDMLTARDIRKPVDLLVDAEAMDAVNRMASVLGPKAKMGQDLYVINSWVNKSTEFALRLAAVLMLADTFGEGREVEAKYVETACQMVVQYFVPQAIAAKDMMTWPEGIMQAMHLVATFRERETFSLAQAATKMHMNTSNAKRIILFLEERGVLDIERRGRALICTIEPNIRF